MKKLLKRQGKEIYYFKNNVKIMIDKNDKSTHPSGLAGNISSGLYGDIDDCEITEKERETGVDVKNLIKN